MVEVESVADPDIEPQRVKLGDRPERVQINLRAQNDVFLGRSRDRDRARRAEESKRSIFREIDIVVVLDTHRGAEPKLDRAEFEIVWDLVDRLATCLGSCFTSEGRPDGVLSASHSTCAKQWKQKSDGESAE